MMTLKEIRALYAEQEKNPDLTNAQKEANAWRLHLYELLSRSKAPYESHPPIRRNHRASDERHNLYTEFTAVKVTSKISSFSERSDSFTWRVSSGKLAGDWLCGLLQFGLGVQRIQRLRVKGSE